MVSVFGNSFFECSIDFGSQKQPLYLLIDTGSSWTWTSVDDCNPSTSKCVADSFHQLASTTYVNTGVEKKIVYGSTQAIGNISSDLVGLTNSSLSVFADFLSVYSS